MKKFIIPILCVSVLLQNCALVFFGPKEKVRIYPGTAGATVKLNDRIVKENTDTVVTVTVPKKYGAPNLEISKPGFEPQTFKLNRVSRSAVKTFDILGIIFGGGLLATGLGLSASPILSDQDLVAPAFGVGAVLLVPSIVDLASKSANTYAFKQLRFDLIPRVEPVKENTAATIICSSVNFKIQPGTVIGKKYFGKRAENYMWDETANISVEDLTVLANNELYKAGYPVPGLKDQFKESSGTSKFQVKAEVKSINADIYTRLISFVLINEFHLKSEIVWKVYDNRKSKVVFEKTVNTALWSNGQTMKLLLLQSLSGSVKKLMADKSFADVLRLGDERKNISTTSGSEITIAKVAAPAKISDVVASVVTVDLGNGHGSGVIISSDGYVLTNAHVVGDERDATILLNGGISLTGEVLKTDVGTDIALLKIPGKGYKAAAINQNDFGVGNEVFAIGTPGRIDLGQSVSKGILSGKREIDGNIVLQVDVSISPGSSGGPLVNTQNEVIGIVNAKLIGKGIEGIGFAIPVDIALKKLGIKITP